MGPRPTRRVWPFALLLAFAFTVWMLRGDTSEAEPLREVSPGVALEPLARCTFDGESTAPTAESLDGPGEYEVDELDYLFVDPTRSTPPNADYEGAPTRQLPTRVWYPASAEADRPFPLVLYSHGFSSSAGEGEGAGEHLASHGYVVAAPTFPLSSGRAPGGTTSDDLVNQPGDVSFLIDQLLAKSSASGEPLEGLLDPSRVVAMGTSMGGMTTSLVAFHPRLGDRRVRAAVLLAAPASMFDETFYAHRALPTLAIHGTLDAIVYYESNAERLLRLAPSDVTLVTLEGGSHAGFIPIKFGSIIRPIGHFLLAPGGSHADHPDAFVCGIIADRAADEGSFIEALGGADEGIFVPDEPMPCAPQYLTRPGLDPDRQVSLGRMASLAFLEAHLDLDPERREGACRFLGESLAEMANVRVD